MTFGSFIGRLSAALIASSLAFTPIFAVHAAEDQHKLTVVSFGLFGGQGVFRREATGAAEIVANRFGADAVVVRFNTKTGGNATVEALAATLQAETKKMNGDRDILFLILTSHGSQEGLAVNAGRSAETLKPSNLAGMLKRTGIRYKIVIVSACYSGVFIPPIADADTLVITAADANHSSFGCEDKAKWTYFGDAFFNIALRQTSNLKEGFLLARLLVSNASCARGLSHRTRTWREAETWSLCSWPVGDASALVSRRTAKQSMGHHDRRHATSPSRKQCHA
jgi:hypothetical protein